MEQHRLQFVVGKGGVGKSTVAAALALEAAAKGQRTLAVELGGYGGLEAALGCPAPEPNVPRAVTPNLSLLSVEGDTALAEYLALVIPVRRLLRSVFESRLYTSFVGAAPGLKELMAVGKVWYEADRKLPGTSVDEPVWQSIVVDAGPSGQSLQYLAMPRAAAATFRSGLVHRESVRVASLLEDSSNCCVHVVAIPEDMPLTEAEEIVDRLRGDLALTVGSLFVNRCRPRPPRDLPRAVERLADVCEGGDDTGRALLALARSEQRWTEAQEDGIERTERNTGLAALRLPLLVAEQFGRAELEQLVDVLIAARDESSG